MKKRLFMYLFMFAALTALFIYVNSKSILDSYEQDIRTFKDKIENYKVREIAYNDTIVNLIDENLELLYFNLDNNDDALSYFENDGIDTNQISEFIRNEIYTLNETKGTHPLIPFEGVDSKMLINKIRLLNHKWIIADFSDGSYWGELFMTYEITKNRELKLNVKESFIYPPQSY